MNRVHSLTTIRGMNTTYSGSILRNPASSVETRATFHGTVGGDGSLRSALIEIALRKGLACEATSKPVPMLT